MIPIVGTNGLTLDCNFNTGTLCSWKNSTINGWIIAPINDILININSIYNVRMPRFDHTQMNAYGKYAFVQQLKGKLPITNKASMQVIDNMFANYKGPVCLTLWYYMRTGGTASLNINAYMPNN